MGPEKRDSIYVIAGKDRYLAREACRKLQDQLLGKENDLGLATYDGKTVELAAVLDELRTLPFLAPSRVVVVDQADKFISENRKVLETYFDRPSTTGVLVLICLTWRTNTRLAKMLGKIGKLITADPMKGRKLINWLVRQASSTGKTISPGAAQSLTELVGNDTGRLAAELEKLALYGGSKKSIDNSDIEQLCGPTAEQSIFLINDLIAEGKTGQALQTLDRVLRNDRSAEYSMVGVLTFSLRRLLKARALLDSGLNAKDVPAACGLHHPGLANRFIGQVKRFSTGKLKHLLVGLAEADHATKTGLGNVKLNLEKFIVGAAAI